MPVGPDGDFFVGGLESGPGAFGVAEPFNPVRQIPGAGQVVDENVVEALELRIAQARDFVLPAFIGLNDLGEVFTPVLLNAELDDRSPIPGANKRLVAGEEGERQERSLVLLQPVVDLRVVDVGLASFREERVGAHGHAVDPVQLRGDMPIGLNSGIGAILAVEPLVVVGIEGTVRGHGRFVADDRIHTTGLHIDAAIGKDRQVSGQIELAEVEAKPRIGMLFNAAERVQQSGVGAPVRLNSETKRQILRIQRPFDHHGNLVKEEFVAEAILPSFHGQYALAVGCRRVTKIEPAEDVEPRVLHAVRLQEAEIFRGSRAERSLFFGGGLFFGKARLFGRRRLTRDRRRLFAILNQADGAAFFRNDDDGRRCRKRLAGERGLRPSVSGN